MNRKAYPPTWPLYAALRLAAARWHRRGLLTDEQRQAIDQASPTDFYRPPVWLRVTLFLFTCVAASAAGGTFSLFFLSALQDNSRLYFHLVTVLYAVGGGAVLNLLIRNNRHYRSGVDNALLYTALGAILILLGLLYRDLTGAEPAFGRFAGLVGFGLPALLLQGLAVARYGDPLLALTTVATYLILVAGLLLLAGGTLALPFGLMSASALFYWLLGRWVAPRPDLTYYHTAYQAARVLTLVAGCLSVNYLIVREGNAALTNHTASDEIALAGLFWGLTISIPLTYVCFALRRHDRPLLLTGLALTAFALFTFRYYHSLLPPAAAATLGGAILIGGALAAMRYLRISRYGLTSADDDDEARLMDLEALVVAQQAPDLATGPPAAEGFQGFGGGQMGGGGASGSY